MGLVKFWLLDFSMVDSLTWGIELVVRAVEVFLFFFLLNAYFNPNNLSR